VVIAVSLVVVVVALAAWLALHDRNNRSAQAGEVDYSSAIDTSQQHVTTTEGAR